MIQENFLHIKELLTSEETIQINALMATACYDNGKLTASSSAKAVKENLQVENQSQEHFTIQQIILAALNRNQIFRNAILPKQIHPFLISKYQKDMQYGWHVDSPVMGNMLRTDIAMTIFLNEPEEYYGGELELRTHLGDVKYKLPKGDAICYPCTFLHRVKKVEKGTRQVAVTWIESIVKSQEHRKILFDLYQITEKISETNNLGEEHGLLQQNYSNLMRMWAN